MSVTQNNNVIRIDADNDIYAPPGTQKICGIKYKAGTSASIRADSSASGMLLWEHTGVVDVFEEVELKIDSKGIWVDIAGAAVLYLYLE